MHIVLSVILSAVVPVAFARAQCPPVWSIEIPSWAPSGPSFIDNASTAVVLDADGPGGEPPRIFVAANGPLGAGIVREWTPGGWSPVSYDLGFSVGSLAVWDADGDGPNPPALVAGNNQFAGLATWTGDDWRAAAGRRRGRASALDGRLR